VRVETWLGDAANIFADSANRSEVPLIELLENHQIKFDRKGSETGTAAALGLKGRACQKVEFSSQAEGPPSLTCPMVVVVARTACRSLVALRGAAPLKLPCASTKDWVRNSVFAMQTLPVGVGLVRDLSWWLPSGRCVSYDTSSQFNGEESYLKSLPFPST